MNFSQFLNTIYARRKLLLSTLFFTVAVTLALSLAMPTTYKATATLVLNYKGIDPLNGVVIPAQLMPGYMATQAGVIASKRVAEKVVEDLKLAESESTKHDFEAAARGDGNIRDWLADQLLKKVSVDASRDSSVVSINVKAADPQFAANVANAFASSYQDTTVELRSGPMKKLSLYLNDQISKLREELQNAHDRRTRLLQENGIVNVDERIDVETARLNTLATQLVVAQTQLVEATSRSRQAQGTGQNDSPDVIANPLIQNLKAAVAQAEANFAKIATRFESEHPSYQAAQADLEKARAALRENIRSTSASVGTSARIAERRAQELQASFDAQKQKVLQLNRIRAEITILDKEVDGIQRAYDASANRFHQISVEANANQADVAVLNPATPPLKPSGPNVLSNTLLSVALGVVLGIGICLIAELLDRRVRSMTDLELIQVPVLGTVKWDALASQELRLALPRSHGLPMTKERTR